MKVLIKSISIIALSLTLFACDDSGEKTAKKGNSALSSMNEMNDEFNGYLRKDINSTSMDELEYMKKRVKKYIGHADRAISAVNDPDTAHYGDEQLLYKNRSLAQNFLRRVENQIFALTDPNEIKKREQAKKEEVVKKDARRKKQANRDELSKGIEKFNFLNNENAEVFKSTRLFKNSENPDIFISMSIEELEAEKRKFMRLDKINSDILLNIKNLEENPEWVAYKSGLSIREKTNLDRVFNKAKELAENSEFIPSVIDAINRVIDQNEIFRES